MSQTNTAQTSTASSRGSVRATFVAAYSAVTLAQITNALPGALNGTFAVEFQTSGAGLTWIAGMFMMGIVVFELSWGLLGDLFGRKKLLYAGAAVSVAGSVLAALASNTEMMIAAQAVGGIGAGILFPISLSMIAAITPDHRARAKVIATWAGFLSLGAVISPVLAGLTAQVFTVAGAGGGRAQRLQRLARGLLRCRRDRRRRSHRRAPGEGLRSRRGAQAGPARPDHPRARPDRRPLRHRAGGRRRLRILGSHR